MGPRRRCRGRRQAFAPVRTGKLSFNGATTKVSWKASEDWDFSESAAQRFNGATTKVSWKAFGWAAKSSGPS